MSKDAGDSQNQPDDHKCIVRITRADGGQEQYEMTPEELKEERKTWTPIRQDSKGVTGKRKRDTEDCNYYGGGNP